MLYNGIDSTLRVDYKAEFVVKIFFIIFVITFKCNDYSCNNYSWVTKLFFLDLSFRDLDISQTESMHVNIKALGAAQKRQKGEV